MSTLKEAKHVNFSVVSWLEAKIRVSEFRNCNRQSFIWQERFLACPCKKSPPSDNRLKTHRTTSSHLDQKFGSN